MQNYKAPDNSMHCIEPEFAHLLPQGCIAITEEEAEALRPKSPEADPKDAIRAQIKQLEAEQLMPRATREFMLTFMELNAPAEVLAVNPGYQAVKAFDNQIKALRDLL
jgi:hypothetical protein